MTTKKKATEPSTEELLAQLNAATEAAQKEDAKAAEPVIEGELKLPAGSLKVCILLPHLIAENDRRSAFVGARLLPTWIVWERMQDGTTRSHYAHSFTGSGIEPRSNPSGKRPNWIPERLPDTSGTSPTDFLNNVQWFLASTEEVTVYTLPREFPSVDTPPASAAPPRDIRWVELPSMVIPTTAAADTTEALSVFARAITAAHSANRWSQAAAAAEAFNLLAPAVAALDRVPVPPGPPKGDPRIGLMDGSKTLKAAGPTGLPAAQDAAYASLLGSFAPKIYTAKGQCESAAYLLMQLRDNLKALATPN